MRSRFDPNELDDIRFRHKVSDVFTRLGFQLKRAGGNEWVMLCPLGLEKTPSFSVSDRRCFYHCFHCGEHGDVFDAVMMFKGCNFIQAVEHLGGTRRLEPAERARVEERRKQLEAQEEAERKKTRTRIERAWDRFVPIDGTRGEEYFRARQLECYPNWTFDLRFAPALQYRGFPHENAEETADLGEYPAVVAAIRDGDQNIIGLHRTYLDPERPAKLFPPGDQKRNRAKKILGEQRGGLIWLSPPAERIGCGEGIETTRSWLVLCAEREPDTGIAAGISLGNISGRGTGTLRHPANAKKTVPNGFPDLEQPWIKWPEGTKELVFIGDGDSDRAMTSARLMCGLRRAAYLGITAYRQFAPDGMDFNNMLVAEAA